MLKIPTCGRQTTWVFTEHLQSGATVKQIQVVRAGLEPGASALTTTPRRLPKDIKAWFTQTNRRSIKIWRNRAAGLPFGARFDSNMAKNGNA